MKPFDPYCGRWAADMTDYDPFLCDSPEEWAQFKELSQLEKGNLREEFVRTHEGTYNSSNGHFACDDCYIHMGCPTTPSGWKAL